MSPTRKTPGHVASAPRRGAAAPHRAHRTAAPSGNGRRRGASVTVRMYNVGFGDAFLRRIPTRDGERKVLIDCGTHPAGGGPRPMREVVQQIIADVTDRDGVPRIDVVVGTHRHRDHVSGFDDPAWDAVEVREVWMPWTEDPKDKQARKIRERQSRLAMQLDAALANPAVLGALPASVDDAQKRQLAALVRNALTNAEAMRTLHDGFAGRPLRRFLPNKTGDRTLDSSALPGVTVHVMGPSRDVSVIRDMDPPQGAGYLRRLDAWGLLNNVAPQPFHSDWSMTEADFVTLAQWDAAAVLSDADRQIIRESSAGEELAIAVALEKAVNGTSLMLLFQVGKAHLLFPGDAQWGTWRVAMADQEWRELLEKTVFYKIGHHGSHNATPKEFVERILGQDFWAMASTHPVKQWPQIPKAGLMQALTAREKQHRVVRSDKGAQLPAGFKGEDDRYIEAEVPV